MIFYKNSSINLKKPGEPYLETASFKPSRLFLVITLLILLIITPDSVSAKSKRIVILPFNVNAEKDLSFLKNGIVAMLNSRLSWNDKVMVVSGEETAKAFANLKSPANENRIRDMGTKLDVDYVLYGSLTAFGNSMSIDIKFADVSGKTPTLAFFYQSQSMDEVIPGINRLAGEINERVFGRKPVGRSLPDEKSRQRSSIYAHPEQLLSEKPVEPGKKPEIKEKEISPSILQKADKEITGFWTSSTIKMEIKGIALGDVDGDGKIETVAISSNRILVYRSDRGRFFKIKEISGKRNQRFIAVDVADIKRNGSAEIFVTCLNTNPGILDSFVLEWNGYDFRPVAQGENWYYRVHLHPELGAILLGQKRGGGELFYSSVQELVWNGTGYVSQNKIQLPGNTSIFGFVRGDIINNGSTSVISLDDGDRLRILTQSGEQQWKSEERYGGSENYMVFPTREDSERRIYLPQRLFITDLDKDGKNELVVVKNQAATGRLFMRYRRYSSGSFETLGWDGLGLSSVWHTRKISGYISDYCLGDIDNDGKQEIVGAVVTQRGSILKGFKSAIIAYDVES